MRQDLAIRRFNRIVDDLFSNRFMPVVNAAQGQFYLNTDISDKGDYFELKSEMPGVNKDDVEVEIDNRNIRIAVKTNSSHEETKENYLLKEIVAGSTSRSFTFGELLDSEAASADFENGVLVLKVPKKNTPAKKVLTFKSE